MTPASSIDRHLLTTTAFDALALLLEGHGNVLSGMHRAALYELLDTFSGYVTGTERGRQAFGLPTGMGKTSAIVAFVSALFRLGYQVPVAVAASRVQALCKLKREMVGHGVPSVAIGIKHSTLETGDGSWFEPSTGSVSHLVQLVTHARVRSGNDFKLFGEHQGERRALMVYDETLMRSDSFAFSEMSMRKALGLLTIELEKRSDPVSLGLVSYLGQCSGIIAAALEGLRSSGDAHGNGAAIDLPPLDGAVVDAYRAAVRSVSRGLGPWSTDLDSLLSVSQEALQVLTAEQGGGAVSVREAVPAQLRDVVILDASTPVRELVRLDPTVRAVESFASGDLKSFEAVEVYQLLAAGGRASIENSYRQKSREAAAVSLEVLDIIEKNKAEKAFLIFSFLPRVSADPVDILDRLRRDLTRGGVDLQEKVTVQTAKGDKVEKSRFEFLTWGNQEGLNGYEHCSAVIMAGVLHRGHLDIAAAVKGQAGHLAEPTPSDRLRRVIESEIAHVVFQGASRGSCRRINNGKALPMKLYLIHRSAGLKGLLDKVMPGAVWFYPEPGHLKKATGEGKAAQLLGQLVVYLKELPSEVQKVSSTAAKRALGLGPDNATRQAFTRCLELLDPAEHGWTWEGRSLVRQCYGFEDRS